jgi:tetratricopeptide (TPR) repeat protein
LSIAPSKARIVQRSGTSAADYESLLNAVAWAKRQRFSARELVPMLERLIAAAPPEAHERRSAKLELAELSVASRPFRAARLAREVLAGGDDDRAFGVLGLAHTLLGNYRAAARAYRRAIALAPRNASYRHNLGHLLDVVFERPREALPHLEIARHELCDEPEIASSLAHALLRAGAPERAARVLQSAIGENAEAVLEGWRVKPSPGSDPKI